MRSAFIAAALVASTMAVPFVGKRAVVTETETNVVVVTEIVTVTANGAASTSAVSTTSAVTSSATTAATTSATSVTSATSASSSATSASSSASSVLVDPVSTTKKASSSTPTTYKQIAVYHHNIHRANHSSPAIKWSTNLAESAKIIAESCIYEHNTTVMGGGYGQNIAAGVKRDNISAVITDLFYNGEVGWFSGLYGEAQPSMVNFEHWGHFSQVVWANSQHLGCYTADCSSGGLANVGDDVAPYFTVCNYKGAGNYANEYGDNIGEPLGHATASWSTGLNVNQLPK